MTTIPGASLFFYVGASFSRCGASVFPLKLAAWVLAIGVLFVCSGRTIDGDSWFTWWFFLIYQENQSISPKRTPMVLALSVDFCDSDVRPLKLL